MGNSKQYLLKESNINLSSLQLFRKALDLGKRLSPEEEEAVISKSYLIAKRYAQDIIKGRWPEFEKQLIKNLDYNLVYYVRDVIKDRWPEIEPLLSGQTLEAYLSTFPVDRREEIQENIIRHDPALIKNFVYTSKRLQQLAIDLGGKRILLLIKSLHPEIKAKYPEIINLKRSGLFR